MAKRPRAQVPVVMRVTYVVDAERANRVLDLLAEGVRRAIVRQGHPPTSSNADVDS